MTRRLRTGERWVLVALLLAAWGLRWVALAEVPPGWRDDDLIELYTFSQRVLEEGPTLYFPGASGHEPLYHTLRAPLIAAAGLNLAAARWMGATFGTLSVLLTWAVGRRLFTREVGLLSGALVAVSFWHLMYSRVAIRHIGALPWMLLALYWGWRTLQDERPPPAGAPLGIILGTGGALLTYYAGRLIPALLLVALPVVGCKKGRWRPYLIALALGLVLAAPMFWAAAQLPGADARVSELAVPLRELRAGNLRPLLQTTWTTLGMAHARGDPEWLYNVPERPVFGAVGALLFYLGIVTRLAHPKQANARWMLLWLGVGIAPAFISLPPSSYGHTILALPAVYILTTMPMKAAARRWRWTAVPLIVLTLGAVTARDLPAYFGNWPRRSMVRFLYRADYRDLARHLDAHPEIEHAAVDSLLHGPWDKVAVRTDMQREDVALRWVNPGRALVFRDTPVSRDTALPFYVNPEHLHPRLRPLVELGAFEGEVGALHRRRLPTLRPPEDAVRHDVEGEPLVAQPFAGALALEAVSWETAPRPGGTAWVKLWWEVSGDLPLPPEELISNPPPPGVYNGPRLSIFAHLWAAGADKGGDEQFLGGDDSLGVDPYSLRPGDHIVQVHRFDVPADGGPGPYTLAVGLYDPLTGQRWPLPDEGDQIVVAAP